MIFVSFYGDQSNDFLNDNIDKLPKCQMSVLSKPGKKTAAIGTVGVKDVQFTELKLKQLPVRLFQSGFHAIRQNISAI